MGHSDVCHGSYTLRCPSIRSYHLHGTTTKFLPPNPKSFSIEIPAGLLSVCVSNGQSILKPICKSKGLRVVWKKKSKAGGLLRPHFKTELQSSRYFGHEVLVEGQFRDRPMIIWSADSRTVPSSSVGKGQSFPQTVLKQINIHTE